MKFLIALATVLSITATCAEWTCDDCTAVVNSIAAYLTSEESIAKQVDMSGLPPMPTSLVPAPPPMAATSA